MAVVGDPESHLTADEGQHPSYGSFPVAKGIDQEVDVCSEQNSVSEHLLNNSGLVRAEKTCLKRCLGIFLAFLSGVFMTIYSSLLKLLIEMDSLQVALVRGVLQVIIMALIVAKQTGGWSGLKNFRTSAILAGIAVSGGLRIAFIFTSFTRLPLGDSTAILFSSPVIVMGMSICLLKERCGLFRIFASASLVAGVILITKPPLIFGSPEGGFYDFLGYSLCIGACFMSALGLVLTKLIALTVGRSTILFFMGLAIALCGGIGLAALGKPSLLLHNPQLALHDWTLAISIGLLGLVQQYVLIWAITLESPAVVTCIRSLQILLAYGVQVLGFHQQPIVTDVVGALLILSTVVAITVEKARNERAQTSEQEALDASVASQESF